MYGHPYGAYAMGAAPMEYNTIPGPAPPPGGPPPGGPPPGGPPPGGPPPGHPPPGHPPPSHGYYQPPPPGTEAGPFHSKNPKRKADKPAEPTKKQLKQQKRIENYATTNAGVTLHQLCPKLEYKEVAHNDRCFTISTVVHGVPHEISGGPTKKVVKQELASRILASMGIPSLPVHSFIQAAPLETNVDKSPITMLLERYPDAVFQEPVFYEDADGKGFTVDVTLKEMTFWGYGTTKKMAKAEAARALLENYPGPPVLVDDAGIIGDASRLNQHRNDLKYEYCEQKSDQYPMFTATVKVDGIAYTSEKAFATKKAAKNSAAGVALTALAEVFEQEELARKRRRKPHPVCHLLKGWPGARFKQIKSGTRGIFKVLLDVSGQSFQAESSTLSGARTKAAKMALVAFEESNAEMPETTDPSVDMSAPELVPASAEISASEPASVSEGTSTEQGPASVEVSVPEQA